VTLDYEQAVAHLTGLGRFGIKAGLERTRAILDELGHPERGLRGALVAGTNGKGSTAAFLEAILRAGGLRVGTLPSPHLRSYNERVQVDGVPIAEAEFARAVSELLPRLEPVSARLGQATEFELLIALALQYLGRRVDRLVAEVGMGGRLDATNVLDLGVAVITNVALDHTQYLGDTVELIAAEKAGVIKTGNTVVTGAEGAPLEIIAAVAAQRDATLWRLGRELRMEARWLGWAGSELSLDGPGFSHNGLHVPLIGSYQAANAALAVAAAHALGVDSAEAIADTRWPGRFEICGDHPRVILDGGHNPAGLGALLGDVRRLVPGAGLVVVFAAMADKDLSAMLGLLRGAAPDAVVFTAAASAGDRAADPEAMARAYGAGQALLPAATALETARGLAGPAGTVLACGSLYLVGELRG
jgi:dihydrofolate synthase/folylpolyglutamate synthase